MFLLKRDRKESGTRERFVEVAIFSNGKRRIIITFYVKIISLGKMKKKCEIFGVKQILINVIIILISWLQNH